jgi:transcriptional regulator with XRE-family HTH domain
MNVNGLSNAEVISKLCQRIKAARIQQHLSQVHLAERSGLGIATVKRIEMGESITLLTLISILRGLGKLNQIESILSDQDPQTLINGRVPKRIRHSTPLEKIKGNLSSRREQNNSNTIDWYLSATSNKVRWKK